MNIYADNDVVVTGADGMLGRAVVKALEGSDYYRAVRFVSGEMDIANVIDVVRLTGAKIINCAGIVRGRDDVSAKRMGEVNGLAPYILADIAKRLIHVSTDCVFDGTKGPYVESDEPSPIDSYGRSKFIGEPDGVNSLTVRTSFIGMGERGLLRWLLNHPQGATVPGFRQWLWNGWYISAVAYQLVKLIDEPIIGILHLEGPTISKYDLIEKIIKAVRPDLYLVEANSDPKNMILKSERRQDFLACTWDCMIEDLKADYEALS